jgi:uncharacterized protein YqeY
MENIALKIREDLKESMKAKDTLKLNVIRGVLTAFTNELVATNRTPQDTLTDEEAIKVIRRIIKQREDAISQYTAAGRNDLADEDTAQMNVLKTYVPAQASFEDVKIVAEKVKMQMGEIDKSKMGMLIGAVKKEMGDTADGMVIKSVVESLF